MLLESGLFAKYTSREYVRCYETQTSDLHVLRLILATESYGGHYGPEFVVYFDEQNTKIDNGIIEGEKIIISALMINK
jgi:carboxypeptidase C (cathepsin A)